MISHYVAEMERDNIDESTVTEATTTLITELLGHMSETACSQIISSQPFSPMDHPP